MPDFQTERTLANQLTLRAGREACDPSIIELVNCRFFFFFSAFALDKRHNIIVFISHSPQGCVGCTIMAVDMYRVGQAHRGIKLIKNLRVIVTNLDQKSVVFGGEQKLRESVQKAVSRYNPKLIFIYASCASGIIGDDIDAIASDLSSEYPETTFVPIHCEGFKSKICASGFDAAFLSINKYHYCPK